MRRPVIAVVAAVSVIAVVAMYLVVRDHRVAGEPYHAPALAEEDLATVSAARVFFAHQSVGGNILDGVQAVYEEHQTPAPEFVDLSKATPDDRLVHVRIGENGDPLGKIEEFESVIRGGMGERLDVALLKLCYVDVREGTDVEEVFAAYRDTIAALQRDFPDVRFVVATVPVSAERGPLGKLKALLGRGDGFGPEHNVAREEFNSLVRAEYSDSDLLFDVAALQSTSETSERIAGYHDGHLYYALNEAYASDPGHLNPAGASVVAEGLLATLGNALAN